MEPDLTARRHWIFDLDGTLTVAVHDFDAIRRRFGLPEGRGILESIAALPAERAASIRRRLDEYEYELATASTPATGAAQLLDALTRTRARKGIVTRNSLRNLEATLDAIGMRAHFALADVVSRDCTVSRPKPKPDGILRLLEGWGADAASAVMVGNHEIDVEAGRAAGAATVLVADSAPTNGPQPDVMVSTLAELVDRVGDDERAAQLGGDRADGRG